MADKRQREQSPEWPLYRGLASQRQFEPRQFWHAFSSPKACLMIGWNNALRAPPVVLAREMIFKQAPPHHGKHRRSFEKQCAWSEKG